MLSVQAAPLASDTVIMHVMFAARLFSLIILGAVLFQCGLVAGMPWGEFAWGGMYRGQLPVEMRVASACSALLLLVIGTVVLARAGIFFHRWQPLSRRLIWAVVAFCVLSVVANAITPSAWERIIWLPVAIALLVTSVVVATKSRDSSCP
jgi:hypothetical protein